MKKDLLKQISENSETYENVMVCGYKIPFLANCNSAVHLCITDEDNSILVDIYRNVKRQMPTQKHVFIYKIQEDGTGYFYDGHSVVAAIDDIYAAYRVCYDFSDYYLSDGVDRELVALLYAVG